VETYFIPLNTLLDGSWSETLPSWGEDDDLGGVWIQPPFLIDTPEVLHLSSSLLFECPLVLNLPGLDAVSLVLAPGSDGTAIPFEIQIKPDCWGRVSMPIALRLNTDLLRPVRRTPSPDADTPDSFEVDPEQDHLDIQLAEVSLTIGLDGDIDLEADCTIDLPPCMIGDSGVVIEASDIGIYLGRTTAPGKPEGWRGFHMGRAALYLPADLAGSLGALTIEDCYIGNGGFSGTVANTWTPALSTTLGSVELGLKSVGLTFVQNALTESSITGVITLPFFDGSIDVEIGIDFDGGFSLILGGENGLYTFTRENLLEMELESLGMELEDGVVTFKLSGRITPLFGGFDWPSFKLDELSIDSEGNVKFEGGWIDLPDQYSLDFNGFQIEITQLGFGKSDDGGKWIGFSGALNPQSGGRTDGRCLRRRPAHNLVRRPPPHQDHSRRRRCRARSAQCAALPGLRFLS